jgi:DNA-binding LacI/PurR family transcriptional regulator
VARDRFKGYREGLKNHNIPLDSKLTLPCTFDLEKAGNKMKQLLESGIRPDAVICMGGLLAYGAGQAILDAQLKIPEDIFLAEYGDNLLPSRLGVTFLTVNQFPYEIGKTAVDLLIENINNKENHTKPKHVVLDTELIVRKVG